MKTNVKLLIAALAVAGSAACLIAQDNTQNDGPRRPGRMGPDGHRPPPPVIAVLDANHDGVIDADEIANASKALLKLDKNGDGKLTQDELRPPRPENDGGPRNRPLRGPGGPQGDDAPPSDAPAQD